MQLTGYISQIIGPVVDVHFPELGEGGHLPAIHEAMTVVRKDGSGLTVEVQQHIGENTVRSIAMESTDGLQRHLQVRAEGRAISMPTGDQINVSTTATLRKDLDTINAALWNADGPTIEGWSYEVPSGEGELDTDSLSRYAFSIFWKALAFAESHSQPIVVGH